ncbi:hypothetical protein ONS95_004978 [Cadophora gregata]|uniref:uncharacterized protein n=1 Tax=Cadophora gregata TaxID=51156 RepID=UPI0026DC02F4|nr:uncharacterized protein ONS95_004978 [Cadophora gregata]KAK0104705.1 hypothetical protein ONS95_004978 [Cadophora gregata]
MLNLGLQRRSGAFYQILSVDGKGRVVRGAEKVNKPMTETLGSERTIAHDHSSTTPITTPPTTDKAAQLHLTQFRVESSSATANASTKQQPQNQLCRHWCRHGICKWGQQCRYRHSMPMSTSGLQEIGLVHWPVWFRRVNPGYFAAEVVTSNSNLGRSKVKRSVESMGCTSLGGNGGTCCGVLHGPGNVGRERVGETERQSNRLRGDRVERMSGSERGTGRGLRSDELGEQIIARLRTFSREHATMGKSGETASDRSSSASLVERAAARDTKNWEDESDDEDNAILENKMSSKDKDEVGKGKGKLVDVQIVDRKEVVCL